MSEVIPGTGRSAGRFAGTHQEVGLLRLDFGKPEESLEAISWEAFFDKFDESHLALLYEDEPGNRFNKLVSR